VVVKRMLSVLFYLFEHFRHSVLVLIMHLVFSSIYRSNVGSFNEAGFVFEWIHAEVAVSASFYMVCVVFGFGVSELLADLLVKIKKRMVQSDGKCA